LVLSDDILLVMKDGGVDDVEKLLAVGAMVVKEGLLRVLLDGGAEEPLQQELANRAGAGTGVAGRFGAGRDRLAAARVTLRREGARAARAGRSMWADGEGFFASLRSLGRLMLNDVLMQALRAFAGCRWLLFGDAETNCTEAGESGGSRARAFFVSWGGTNATAWLARLVC
jgi:hypothetical protein